MLESPVFRTMGGFWTALALALTLALTLAAGGCHSPDAGDNSDKVASREADAGPGTGPGTGAGTDATLASGAAARDLTATTGAAPSIAGQDDHSPTAPENGAPSPAPAGKAEELEAEWNDAALPGRSQYAGSTRCQECHEKKFTRWSHDWHARALSRAEPKYMVGRFPSHYEGTSSEAWMKKAGSKFVMRTTAADGSLGDFPISWVVGGKRMQDTVTVLPDGRWQVLPVYYHVTGRGEWVDYNAAKQGPVTPDHPFFWSNFRRMANRECLDCHTTGLDVRYDRQKHQWSTRFADGSVACESCHGPGERHSSTKEKSDIIRPSELSKEAELGVCAQCHAPRNPLFPMLDSTHRFKPGDNYDDRYQALVVVEGHERSGEFFADGRPKSSSFEYTGLIQSKCYMKGQATCLSCHAAPHDAERPNELKKPDPKAKKVALPGGPLSAGDQSCRSCHEAIIALGQQHTHHKTPAGQSCIACHMPKVLYSVLDHFADHALDVPTPENTVRHQIPNACNECHVKETPQAMSQAIARLWPNAAARQVRRIILADAIDEATAGKSLPALKIVLADRAEAPILRGTAASLIAQRFPTEAPAALLPLLHDPNQLVRTKALEGLGFANARGTASAIAPLTRDPSLQVRHMAALVLASFNAPGADEALRALVNDPKSEGLVQPHVMSGVAAARRGDFVEAEKQLERALDLMPYNTNALLMVGDMYAREGKADLARERVEEALSFDPQNKGALDRMAAMSGQ